ncbi:MAG: T9SS type A sorting domain-containing protein [Chitinophagales bacterium]|nr:T9SS type A sorting domain-containing protein [Chitinophagales bacterium]
MKKFLWLLIVAMLATVNLLFAETEPNDTKSQASKINLNSSATGAINPAADGDWWKVATNKDGILSLSLTSISGTYIWVSLYDNDGTSLLTQAYSYTVATISMDGLSPGTYYVYIHCFYNTDVCDYSLSNALTLAPLSNDPEPNGTFAQAIPLSVNATVTGHIGYYFNHVRDTSDWYQVTTAADGRLTLALSVSNGQYVYWQLFDGNGTTYLNGAYTSTSGAYSTDGLAAGNYYVRIICFYSSSFAPYTLTDSLFLPAQQPDTEPNGTIGQAIGFPLNSTLSGHIGYYHNTVRDTVDWYKIVTNEDGMITLSLNIYNSQYVWWQLFDTDGITLLASTFTSSSGVISKDGLAAGTYYARIICYYNSGFAPYTLSNGLSLYQYADDGLFNEHALNASTLPANYGTSGHVGFRSNGGAKDLIDWWKINYTGNGNATITLNFEKRLDAGYSPYTYMQVYKDTLTSPVFSSYNSSGTVTANLSSLSQGTYYIAVFLYYNTEWVSYQLTPAWTQTNCVTAVTATKVHSGSTCTNSYITFQATGGSGQLYLQLYHYGEAVGTPVAADATGSHKFNQLEPGSYTCRGFSDGATGDCYATSAVKKVVPVVTGLSATDIGKKSVDLSWTTFSCVDYYLLRYREAGTSKWTKKTTDGNVGTFHVTQLTPGTNYEFRVAANDSANGQTAKGAYSDFGYFTTLSSTGKSTDLLQGDQELLSIYPNPVTSVLEITFVNETDGNILLRLTDVNGKVVFSNRQNLAAGTVHQSVDLTRFQSGMYQLQIITAGGRVMHQSIVKVNE